MGRYLDGCIRGRALKGGKRDGVRGIRHYTAVLASDYVEYTSGRITRPTN